MLINKPQDIVWPPGDQQSYNNQLTGFMGATTSNGQLQFVFKQSGECSTVKPSVKLVSYNLPKEDSQIQRVVMWYQNTTGFLVALQIYTDDEETKQPALDFGWADGSRKGSSCSQKEYVLEKGERIVGVQARKGTDACHHDVQLVVMKK